MLGIAEDHHPLIALTADQAQGRLRLFQRGAGDAELVNVRAVFLFGFHGDFHLVPLVHPGHRHDLLGDGGRKQPQILPVLHLIDDPGHVLEKAHIQHPVGLVQHNGLDFVQADGLAVVVIHQPPRRRHHDLGLALQLLDLAADARAAVQHRHPNALEIGQQPPQLVADLDGKLPGRGKNQPLNALLGRVDMLDHGDAEGKGLSGAGGRLGDDVPPLQKIRDGLRLNGGGVAVALFLQGFQHGLAQAETFKCNFHGSLSLFHRNFLHCITFPPCLQLFLFFGGRFEKTPFRSHAMVDKLGKICYIVGHDNMSVI